MKNNEELIMLMKKHNLDVQDVASLIEVSYNGVINWLRKGRPAQMPNVALLALRLSIELKRLPERETPT